MIIKTKEKHIIKALEIINKKYAGNIIFNRFEALNNRDNRYRVTLKVKDSSGLGARRGFTGRRLINACWHVHGYFFNALFKCDLACRVYSNGNWIDINYGNWIDKNIGSIMNPLAYSEACGCDK